MDIFTLGIAFAGLSGALAYLPFVRRLTQWFAVVIPLVGMGTAYFLVPAIAKVWYRWYGVKLDADEQQGLAFMVGFSAMVMILPSVLKVINKLQNMFGGKMVDLVVERDDLSITGHHHRQEEQAVIPRGGPDHD